MHIVHHIVHHFVLDKPMGICYNMNEKSKEEQCLKRLRISLYICILALILLTGCGAGDASESSAPSVSSIPDSSAPDTHPSVPEPPTLSEPEISSVEEIPILPGGAFRDVFSGVQFRLPDGWEDVASEEDMLFSVASADGSRSVNAVYTALKQTTGLTEALLIEETKKKLPPLWREAGAVNVETAAVHISLLSEEHDALSLTASVDGEAICQLQVYLFRADGLYTLTVTAEDMEAVQELLNSFEKY